MNSSLLEEDLSVCNGDDVGRDIGGDVACLCFDDRQCGDRTAAVCIVQTAGTFQQTGVQIEYVTRISFTPGRTVEQQGHCTVCHRVLGKVIVYNEHVLALTHEILCDRRAGIGCDILYRSRFAGRCRHDNGILHCIILFQGRNDLCDCRGLLSDCDINTNDILSFLVNDRIHSNRCLTGLTVADDQFTLTASDGEHRVNGKDTGL